MSIYEIAGIIEKALTQSNIIAGVVCTRVCPFNRDIFTEIDFAHSYVTDRPISDNITSNITALPEAITNQLLPPPRRADTLENSSHANILPKLQSISNIIINVLRITGTAVKQSTSTVALSSEIIKPLPEALPRKIGCQAKSTWNVASGPTANVFNKKTFT